MHLSVVILGRGGGSILPGDICGYSIGFVDICCQFLAQDGGLVCLCNSIAESLGEDPWDFICIYQKRLGERIMIEV